MPPSILALSEIESASEQERGRARTRRRGTDRTHRALLCFTNTLPGWCGAR